MPPKKEKIVQKICPRCRKEFNCNEEEGCWCEKIHLTSDMLSYLRLRYIDCLCSSCIESFARSVN